MDHANHHVRRGRYKAQVGTGFDQVIDEDFELGLGKCGSCCKCCHNAATNLDVAVCIAFEARPNN